MTTTPKRSRVIHVPLTDKEWKALHDRAFTSGSSKGEVTATALRAELAKPVAS